MSQKIMVAEDNDQLREMIQIILESFEGPEELNISYAKNGLEAYKALREVPYQLLITDINMPKIDGEALLEIKKEPFFKSHKMKVLVLAGDPKAVQHLYSDDVYTLAKPFDADRLIKFLKIILFQNRV